MGVIRLFLVVLISLSAPGIVDMDANHTGTMGHAHATLDLAPEAKTDCCAQNTDCSQICHLLPALLTGADQQETTPMASERVSIGAGRVMVGVEPSGALDPPRAV